MRNITYAIDPETGLVVSRVGSTVAVPILDWDNMNAQNNFSTSYYLEKMDVMKLAGSYFNRLKWTRCIPVRIKNLHRVFFRFPPLAEEK